jgi:hypothetical protein
MWTEKIRILVSVTVCQISVAHLPFCRADSHDMNLLLGAVCVRIYEVRTLSSPLLQKIRYLCEEYVISVTCIHILHASGWCSVIFFLIKRKEEKRADSVLSLESVLVRNK